MRVGTHLVALLLLLTSLKSALGDKGSRGSGSRRRRRRNDSKSRKTGSGSTPSLSIKSSKGGAAAQVTDLDNNSRSGRSSKGQEKGQSPDVPNDLFRESGKSLTRFLNMS